MARHIRKGDMVIVTAGRDSKKDGPNGTRVRDLTPRKVLRVIPAEDKVVVEGVNVRTKHLRPSQANPQGGTTTLEMPIHISNVSPADKDGKATRVRFEKREDGSKVRLAATTGEQLGQPLKKAR